MRAGANTLWCPKEAAEVNAENSDLLSKRTNSVGEQNSNSNAISFGDVW